MADMTFRWKNRGGNLPQVNPTFVDPQGGMSTMASQGMAGYAPAPQPNMAGYQPNVQPNVRGMATPQATAQSNASLAENAYNSFMTQDKILQDKKQQLAQLEVQLRTIDNQIASLEKGSLDEEKAIAAKLAEIGDTSMYQGILSREQNAGAQSKSAADSIDNILYESDKLTWGLNAKSEEDRDIARQNIRANLERAKNLSEKAGVNLPDKYYELQDKLGGADNAAYTSRNEQAWLNELFIKDRRGTLSDTDIAEMENTIATNPGSDLSVKLQGLVEKYKGRTGEAKGRAAKRRADARNLRNTLNSLDVAEATRRISNLSPYEYKLLEDFYPEMVK